MKPSQKYFYVVFKCGCPFVCHFLPSSLHLSAGNVLNLKPRKKRKEKFHLNEPSNVPFQNTWTF